MKKYNLNEIKGIFNSLEEWLILNDKTEKIELCIVGGVAFMLLNATERNLTKDIDALVLERAGTKVTTGRVEKLIEDSRFIPIINSDVISFPCYGMLEYEDEWIEVFTTKRGIIKVYTPSIEMMIFLKLNAYANKVRNHDVVDINFAREHKAIKMNRVKWLIKEWETYCFNKEEIKLLWESFNEFEKGKLKL